MSPLLHLHLKACYFDAIYSGAKTHEFRLADKWEKKLQGKTYRGICLYRGYPKKGDRLRILHREWRGYTLQIRQHALFGPDPVRVLAIDVTGPAIGQP